MAYQTGNIKRLSHYDPRFSKKEDAVFQAIEESNDGEFHGIYDRETRELIAIVYRQEVFTKAREG